MLITVAKNSPNFALSIALAIFCVTEGFVCVWGIYFCTVVVFSQYLRFLSSKCRSCTSCCSHQTGYCAIATSNRYKHSGKWLALNQNSKVKVLHHSNNCTRFVNSSNLWIKIYLQTRCPFASKIKNVECCLKLHEKQIFDAFKSILKMYYRRFWTHSLLF